MITFPTTPEAFIAYQEYLMGESASEQHILLANSLVGLINKVFADGQAGREQPNIKGDFIASCKKDGKTDMLNDQNVLHIIASASWWCNQAYIAGQEAAHHE